MSLDYASRSMDPFHAGYIDGEGSGGEETARQNLSMTTGRKPATRQTSAFVRRRAPRRPCAALIIATAFRCNCSDEQRPINYRPSTDEPLRFIGEP